MSIFFISQVVATLAFACGIISFQYKKRPNILLLLSCSALLNSFHFFLLGRTGAGTLFFINGFRVFTAAFSTNQRLMFLFMGIIIVANLLTYQDPIDILALFGAMLATFGNFQKNEKKIRIYYLGCAITWIVHNVIIGSPIAVFMEVTFLISNLIGYWRIYRNTTR